VIKYALRCDDAHEFEGWFSSSADFDEQKKDGALSCPVCGSADVRKSLMAPAVHRSRSAAPVPKAVADIAKEWNEAAQRAQTYVRENFEHVGKRFPEEARKIYYGEAPEKPIWGEASAKEVEALRDEGVTVAPVPAPIPSADDTKKKMN
jgi:hypothetical protein